MLEGHAELTLYDSLRYRDEDFIQARKNGHLDRFLQELPVLEHLEGDNMIFHWFAQFMFTAVFSGCPNYGIPFNVNRQVSPPNVYFGTILLNTNTSAPTYQEWNNDYTRIHTPTYSANTGSAGKRFPYDSVENPAFFSDPSKTGREDISCRYRWLYLPSQGVSSNIQSLGVLGSSNRDSTDIVYRYSAARLRFKNSSGVPITINKTSNQVLLVEYTFKLVSV